MDKVITAVISDTGLTSQVSTDDFDCKLAAMVASSGTIVSAVNTTVKMITLGRSSDQANTASLSCRWRVNVQDFRSQPSRLI